MKKLPVFNVDYSNIYSILNAPIKSKILKTALEFKVFKYLNSPLSAMNLAKTLGTQRENTEESKSFLVEELQVYLGDWFLSVISSQDSNLQLIPQLITAGPSEVNIGRKPI